jgi:CRP/FNR family transcriptional regulator, cyclic AMP receptor protein
LKLRYSNHTVSLFSVEEEMKHKDTSQWVRTLPIFEGLGDTVLSLIEKYARYRTAVKDETIFYRGDSADQCYILLSGEVVIVLSSPDGRELIINVMKPQDIFGELALLTGQPRSANAVARLDSELLVIPRKPFLQAMDLEPHLVRRLLEGVAARLSRTSDFENSLAFLDAEARLAWVLLELDSQNEELGYITISQDELAQRAGLIRQTVAQKLGQWRRKGWLLTGRGHIVLLNRTALHTALREKTG